MTKENKEILLKDLCARLPYHVCVKVWLKDGTTEEGKLDLEHNYGDVLRDAFYYNKIVDIKPYLRPMSSMTEEEIKEWDNICVMMRNMPVESIPMIVRFVNSKHLDYYNLIPKGLVLEAPEGMYNFK